MKKMVITLSCIFPLLLSSCKSNGERSFYCLSEDKCVTVWKTGYDDVYIIPSKYKGSGKPDVNHIKTINKQFLTLFFSKQFPNKIIVKDEGNLENNKKMYSIENSLNGEWEFIEYSAEYKNELYNPNASKFNDVKLNTDYLTLNIKENYATDKTGKKIE